MVRNLFVRFTRKPALSMEDKMDRVFSSIRKPLVSYWKPTHCQATDIYDAYVSLWSSTPSESQARVIYNALIHMAISTNKPHPLDWLVAEMLFEAFAASSGDRQWAAHMELTNSCGSKERALDLYKERLARKF